MTAYDFETAHTPARASRSKPRTGLQLAIDRGETRVTCLKGLYGMTMHGGITALRESLPTERSLTPVRRLVPQAGDVLASKRSARADVLTISIVSGADDRRVKRYQEAIDRVRELAGELRVDGWFTCDHTHYARVASFRRHVPSKSGVRRGRSGVT